MVIHQGSSPERRQCIDWVGMMAKSAEQAAMASFWTKERRRDDSSEPSFPSGRRHSSPRSKQNPLLLADSPRIFVPRGRPCDSRSPSRDRKEDVTEPLNPDRSSSIGASRRPSRSPVRCQRLNNLCLGEGERSLTAQQDVTERNGSGCRTPSGKRHFSSASLPAPSHVGERSRRLYSPAPSPSRESSTDRIRYESTSLRSHSKSGKRMFSPAPSSNPLHVGGLPTDRSIYDSSSQRSHSRISSESRATRNSRIELQSPGLTAFFNNDPQELPKEGVKKYVGARQTFSENLKFCALNVAPEDQQQVCSRRLFKNDTSPQGPPWSLHNEGADESTFLDDPFLRPQSPARREVSLNMISSPRSPNAAFCLPTPIGKLGRLPSAIHGGRVVESMAPWLQGPAENESGERDTGPQAPPQFLHNEPADDCVLERPLPVPISPPREARTHEEADESKFLRPRSPARREVNLNMISSPRSPNAAISLPAPVGKVGRLSSRSQSALEVVPAPRSRDIKSPIHGVARSSSSSDLHKKEGRRREVVRSSSLAGKPSDFTTHKDSFVAELAVRSNVTSLHFLKSTVQSRSRSRSAEPRALHTNDQVSQSSAALGGKVSPREAKYTVAERIELLKTEFLQVKAQMRQLGHRRNTGKQSSDATRPHDKLKISISSATTQDSSSSASHSDNSNSPAHVTAA